MGLICDRDMPLLLKEAYERLGARLPVKIEHLLLDIVEWLRRVPARSPRSVFVSDVLRQKILSPYELDGLNRLHQILMRGHDFRPYLGAGSRKIRNRNNLVRIKSLSIKRNPNEWFFADWGLTHFHLGPILMRNGEQSVRTHRILIAYLTDTEAYFVDVIPHGKGYFDAWGQKNLLEAIARNWPEIMVPHEMKGVLSSSAEKDFRAEDYVKAREVGLNLPVNIGGKVYLGPGLGICTDGSSTRSAMLVMRLVRELDDAEARFKMQFPDVDGSLLVRADGGIGFYMPSTNGMALTNQAGEGQITHFFKRLVEETGVLKGVPEGNVWAPRGLMPL